MTQKKSLTVAELLRDLRTKQGATLRGAAGEIGIAPSYLSRLERGERPVSQDVAIRLAEYYGVSPETVTLGEYGIPNDILEILRRNPELIELIRKSHLTQETEDSSLGSSK